MPTRASKLTTTASPAVFDDFFRIHRGSTYLWILNVFHAAGWTFPWANAFAFATQVSSFCNKILYTHGPDGYR